MADWTRTGEDAEDELMMADATRGSRRKQIETQYFSTARTAPRAPHESRIGTDEAHERLQAARRAGPPRNHRATTPGMAGCGPRGTAAAAPIIRSPADR